MYKAAVFLIIALCGVVYAVPSQYDTQEVWVNGNLSYPLPTNILIGGVDPFGYKLYVGRVNYSGTIVPCRVVAETGIASCATELIPFTTRTYQLLSIKDNTDYEWIRSYDGHLEEYALSVGTSHWNERVFICRVHTDGGIIIGSLFLSTKACHVQNHAYTCIHSFDKYEVLVALPKGF